VLTSAARSLRERMTPRHLAGTCCLLFIGVAIGLMSLPEDADAGSTPSDYSVRGIDVSNHQRTVDWPAIASARARFAYVKTTEGLKFEDPYYGKNRDGAKKNGIYVGGYHYALPDRSTGKEQADFFLKELEHTNDGKTLPPMLDIEWPSRGSDSPSPCYGLSDAEMVAWIKDFVDRILERTGRNATIYTNTNWWNQCTGKNASFGKNPLFIANYTGSPTPLPPGWRTWAIWQHSDKGKLPGDQNVFNGSAEDLAALAGASRTRSSSVVSSLADVNGDGGADVVARDASGTLWLYPSNGTKNRTEPVGRRVRIGKGWNDLTLLCGDVTGDRKADILSRDPDGTLLLYPSTGKVVQDKILGKSVRAGSGWTGVTIGLADVTGDNRADVVARDASGILRLHPATGKVEKDRVLGKAVRMGTGWNDLTLF
jgi:GH25 family lysozyme M1 (1,4-beta-N-acetylmuramidase)